MAPPLPLLLCLVGRVSIARGPLIAIATLFASAELQGHYKCPNELEHYV